MNRMSRGSYCIKWRPEDSSVTRTGVMREDRSLVVKSEAPESWNLVAEREKVK